MDVKKGAVYYKGSDQMKERQQVEMSRRDKATEDTKGRKVKEKGRRGDREA